MTVLHTAYFLPLACTNTRTIQGAHYRHAPQIYADAYRVPFLRIFIQSSPVLFNVSKLMCVYRWARDVGPAAPAGNRQHPTRARPQKRGITGV